MSEAQTMLEQALKAFDVHQGALMAILLAKGVFTMEEYNEAVKAATPIIEAAGEKQSAAFKEALERDKAARGQKP